MTENKTYTKNFRVTPESLKLLNRLPQKYYERFYMLEKDSDLIDDCKYMLYLDNGYKVLDDCDIIPVKNITEAIQFIKDSYK